jgi:hypothetical protein
MKSVRTHRSPVAWLLYALILFSGLACSIGHGQMLGSMMSGAAGGPGMNTMQDPATQPPDLHAGMHMDTSTAAPADRAHPGGSMSMMFGDCTFAGTVTLALSFFLTFGWLMRRRPAFLSLPRLRSGMSLRDSLPARHPQAP